MLDPDPRIIGDKRLLGVVPGKPAVGDRKEPAEEDTVMVWPNLLVRHAVAALVVIAIVVVISVFFDAPLREIEPHEHTEPGEGTVVLRGAPGTPCALPSVGGRRTRSRSDHHGARRTPLR